MEMWRKPSWRILTQCVVTCALINIFGKTQAEALGREVRAPPRGMVMQGDTPPITVMLPINSNPNDRSINVRPTDVEAKLKAVGWVGNGGSIPNNLQPPPLPHSIPKWVPDSQSVREKHWDAITHALNIATGHLQSDFHLESTSTSSVTPTQSPKIKFPFTGKPTNTSLDKLVHNTALPTKPIPNDIPQNSETVPLTNNNSNPLNHITHQPINMSATPVTQNIQNSANSRHDTTSNPLRTDTQTIFPGRVMDTVQIPSHFNPLEVFLPDHIRWPNQHVSAHKENQSQERTSMSNMSQHRRVESFPLSGTNTENALKYIPWPNLPQDSIINNVSNIKTLTMPSPHSLSVGDHATTNLKQEIPLANLDRITQLKQWPFLNSSNKNKQLGQAASPTLHKTSIHEQHNQRPRPTYTDNTNTQNKKTYKQFQPKSNMENSNSRHQNYKQWPQFSNSDNTRLQSQSPNIKTTNVSGRQQSHSNSFPQNKLLAQESEAPHVHVVASALQYSSDNTLPIIVVKPSTMKQSDDAPIQSHTLQHHHSETTNREVPQIKATAQNKASKNSTEKSRGEEYNEPWLHAVVQQDLKNWGFPYDKEAQKHLPPIYSSHSQHSPQLPITRHHNDNDRFSSDFSNGMNDKHGQDVISPPTKAHHLTIVETPLTEINRPLSIKNVHVIVPQPDNIPPIPLFRPAEKKPLPISPYIINGVSSRIPGQNSDNPMLVVPYPAQNFDSHHRSTDIYPVMVPLKQAGKREILNPIEKLMQPIHDIFQFDRSPNNPIVQSQLITRQQNLPPFFLLNPPSRVPNQPQAKSEALFQIQLPGFGPPKGEDVVEKRNNQNQNNVNQNTRPPLSQLQPPGFPQQSQPRPFQQQQHQPGSFQHVQHNPSLQQQQKFVSVQQVQHQTGLPQQQHHQPGSLQQLKPQTGLPQQQRPGSFQQLQHPSGLSQQQNQPGSFQPLQHQPGSLQQLQQHGLSQQSQNQPRPSQQRPLQSQQQHTPQQQLQNQPRPPQQLQNQPRPPQQSHQQPSLSQQFQPPPNQVPVRPSFASPSTIASRNPHIQTPAIAPNNFNGLQNFQNIPTPPLSAPTALQSLQPNVRPPRQNTPFLRDSMQPPPVTLTHLQMPKIAISGVQPAVRNTIDVINPTSTKTTVFIPWPNSRIASSPSGTPDIGVSFSQGQTKQEILKLPIQEPEKEETSQSIFPFFGRGPPSTIRPVVLPTFPSMNFLNPFNIFSRENTQSSSNLFPFLSSIFSKSDNEQSVTMTDIKLGNQPHESNTRTQSFLNRQNLNLSPNVAPQNDHSIEFLKDIRNSVQGKKATFNFRPHLNPIFQDGSIKSPTQSIPTTNSQQSRPFSYFNSQSSPRPIFVGNSIHQNKQNNQQLSNPKQTPTTHIFNNNNNIIHKQLPTTLAFNNNSNHDHHNYPNVQHLVNQPNAPFSVHQPNNRRVVTHLNTQHLVRQPTTQRLVKQPNTQRLVNQFPLSLIANQTYHNKHIQLPSIRTEKYKLQRGSQPPFNNTQGIMGSLFARAENRHPDESSKIPRHTLQPTVQRTKSAIRTPESNPARTPFLQSQGRESLGPEMIKFTIDDVVQKPNIYNHVPKTNQVPALATNKRITQETANEKDLDLSPSEEIVTIVQPASSSQSATLMIKSSTPKPLKRFTMLTQQSTPLQKSPSTTTPFKFSSLSKTNYRPNTPPLQRAKIQINIPTLASRNSPSISQPSKPGLNMPTTYRPHFNLSTKITNKAFIPTQWGFTQPTHLSSKTTQTLGKENMKKINFPSAANSRYTVIEATPMPQAGEVFPTLKEFKMFTSPLPPVNTSPTATGFITTTTLPSKSTTTVETRQPEKLAQEDSIKQTDTSSKKSEQLTRLLPPSLIMMRKRPEVMMPGRWNHRTILKPPQVESDSIIKINTKNNSQVSQSSTHNKSNLQYSAPPRKVFHMNRPTPKPALITEKFSTFTTPTTTKSIGQITHHPAIIPSPAAVAVNKAQLGTTSKTLTQESRTVMFMRHPTANMNKNKKEEREIMNIGSHEVTQTTNAQYPDTTTETTHSTTLPSTPLAGRKNTSFSFLQRLLNRRRNRTKTTSKPIVTSTTSTPPPVQQKYKNQKTESIPASSPSTLIDKINFRTSSSYRSRVSRRKTGTTKQTSTTTTPKTKNSSLDNLEVTDISNFKDIDHEHSSSGSSSLEWRQPIQEVLLQDHPEIMDLFNWEPIRIDSSEYTVHKGFPSQDQDRSQGNTEVLLPGASQHSPATMWPSRQLAQDPSLTLSSRLGAPAQGSVIISPPYTSIATSSSTKVQDKSSFSSGQNDNTWTSLMGNLGPGQSPHSHILYSLHITHPKQP